MTARRKPRRLGREEAAPASFPLWWRGPMRVPRIIGQKTAVCRLGPLRQTLAIRNPMQADPAVQGAAHVRDTPVGMANQTPAFESL